MSKLESGGLMLRFSESRLIKKFLRYEPKPNKNNHPNSNNHDPKFILYKERTEERKKLSDDLRTAVPAEHDDYFSETTRAFSALIETLLELRNRDVLQKNEYEIEGLASKHYRNLKQLIELHRKGEEFRRQGGDKKHSRADISTILGHIQTQVEDANELYSGFLSRLFSRA